ncbi:MAG TPA: hypothetical protein VF121_07565 [Thermoanaerobaculia bacterium]|nr:hypothetical protein [Thermoanaerobaculia bacterium]
MIAKIGLDFLPQVLSAFAAGLSIYLATQKYSKAATLSATLHRSWAETERRLEILWGEVDSLPPGQIAERWKALEDERDKDSAIAAEELPFNKKLAAECQESVMQEHGFATAA